MGAYVPVIFSFQIINFVYRLQRLHGSFKSNEGSSEGQKEVKMRSALESGWRFIDYEKRTYQLSALPESLERVTLVFRGDGVTRFRIFSVAQRPSSKL